MLTSKQEIKNWLDEHKIQNYTINDDLTIDVDGNVDLHDRKLKKLPFQFGNVNGYFDCSYNQLTSLEHCPKTVNGGFYCYNNQLTSLEHCPETVNGSFYCYNNPINSINELFDIQVNGSIVIPYHLEESNEWKLLQKIKNLC